MDYAWRIAYAWVIHGFTMDHNGLPIAKSMGKPWTTHVESMVSKRSWMHGRKWEEWVYQPEVRLHLLQQHLLYFKHRELESALVKLILLQPCTRFTFSTENRFTPVQIQFSHRIQLQQTRGANFPRPYRYTLVQSTFPERILRPSQTSSLRGEGVALHVMGHGFWCSGLTDCEIALGIKRDPCGESIEAPSGNKQEMQNKTSKKLFVHQYWSGWSSLYKGARK